MCGRYALTTPADLLEHLFRIAIDFDLSPRYNIAPTQKAPIVRAGGEDGERELVPMRWGLIPSWAKDPAIGNRMINARVETAPEKPSFRAAFKRRRCLVPADAFYEWKKDGSRKQPFAVRMPENRPFALGGLWETWRDTERDEVIESFTILTTTPTAQLRTLHDRMPVVIDPDRFDLWLDGTIEDRKALSPALESAGASALAMYPVSTQVNSPRNDAPAVLEEVVISGKKPAPAADGDDMPLFEG